MMHVESLVEDGSGSPWVAPRRGADERLVAALHNQDTVLFIVVEKLIG